MPGMMQADGFETGHGTVQILAAAKNRETEYERRGINNPRAAARLKKEKTTKPSVDNPRSSEPGLQWRIG